MQYSELKNNFINNVFVPYMKGEIGQARITLASIYRDGKNNPRGTVYGVLGAFLETRDIYLNTAKELKKAGREEELVNIYTNYVNFSNEISKSKHPLIEKALDEIKHSAKGLYPKSNKYSSFIMLKETFPFLGKLKFLARFL